MIANHLLQSTVFAGVVGLVTLLFRRNRAEIRYWLWLVASVKFLVPFSILVSLGTRVSWRTPVVVMQSGLPSVIAEMSQPFTVQGPFRISPAAAAGPNVDWILIILWTAWAIGFVVVVSSWWLQWRSLRAAMLSAAPLDLPVPVPALTSSEFAEPGVYGIRRPVLLLPAGITEQLTPSQMEAILAHELCHVRRRDNLATAIHMAVEAVFWFHPLVWWLGARLMEERERACDEEVVRMGNEPQVYAEGILKICELYLESPLACVAGVTGANLRQRIEIIMANGDPLKLNLARRVALTAAALLALALPILVGVLNAPPLHAQFELRPTVAPKFEVASIKACKSDVNPGIIVGGGSPGRLTLNCQTLRAIIDQAYYFFANARFDTLGMVTPLEGGPGWVNTDRFTIEAKPEGAPGSGLVTQGVMRGPMTRALLEDRFKTEGA